ncbi:MAG: twin-arginine translocase subunit TatC [Ilumatobacteraceae bacterium]
MSEAGAVMPMLEHLRELRTRIVRIALAVAAGTIVFLVFYGRFKDLLTKPYVDICAANNDLDCDGSLYSLGPLDGFSARVRISVYGGILLSLPVIVWQIWRFIVPALESRERRYAVPFLLSSAVLFVAGCSLGYWTLGQALEFLIAWAGDDITEAYRINDYVNLVALMMLAFGVGFLSPVLIVFLQLVGVVSPRALLRKWRHAVMGIFVLAAVITPSGDPVTLLALAVPLSVMYLVAVLVGWLVLRRRSRTAPGA